MFSNWYSGATLLAILLNNHSQLVCNGETFPFQYDESNSDIYVCSCGKHMRLCDFYTQTTKSLKTDKGNWNNDFRIMPNISRIPTISKIVCSFNKHVWLRDLMLRTGLPLRKRLDNYLKAHQQFYKRAREYYGADCYIDGTKSIRRAELFLKYDNNTIKGIYLIRDGRGFCWSYLKNKKLSNDKLPEAAKSWNEYVEIMDIFMKRYSDVEILTVRYEDLCNEPKDTLCRICLLLGVNYEERMIGNPMNHHLLGNRMRSNFDGNIIEDLSWKKKFSRSEIKYLNEAMSVYLKEYGYL
ncbi:uncharacterized protein Dvar_37900 [Desulfosarcina variabilis str. Montpellier]